MHESLTHPEAAQLLESLVASGGGLLSYGLGAPGREIAAVAGAQLAADAGTSLTIVDFRHLLPQLRSVVEEAHPNLVCAYVPVSEAEDQLPSPDGVLVVHTDLLRVPRTRTALLAMAGAAGKLVVAAREEFDASVLDGLSLPRFPFRHRGQRPSTPQEPTQCPGRVHQPAQAAGLELQVRWKTSQSGDVPTHLTDFVARWSAPPAAERAQRLLRQGGPQAHPGEDSVSYEELAAEAALIQNADPDELRRRLDAIAEQQEQRITGYPAPDCDPNHLDGRDPRQEQRATPQQHVPQSHHRR